MRLPGKRRLPILLIAAALVFSGSAQDLETSFESGGGSGDFTLGTSPRTVTFAGGTAKSVGNGSLYRSSLRSWMVRAATTGDITFETPATEVILYLKDQRSSVRSVLTFLTADGEVVATFDGTADGLDGMGFTRVQVTGANVKTITLENGAQPDVEEDIYGDSDILSEPYSVIDDFSFTALQTVELTEKQFLAHFGSGGGLQSDVVVFNPSSTATAMGEVDFFDDDGAPLDSSVFLPGGNSFTLAPLGSATLSTTGAGDLFTGSATVTSDSPIAAVIRFDINGVGVAGVAASQVLTSAIAPVRRVGTLSSGVAFRNTGTSPIQVTLELKDESGNVVSGGTEARTLAGNAKIAEFIEALFPNAQTTTFAGTICVTAQSGQIAVIVLELDVFNNVFTTLPVSEVT